MLGTQWGDDGRMVLCDGLRAIFIRENARDKLLVRGEDDHNDLPCSVRNLIDVVRALSSRQDGLQNAECLQMDDCGQLIYDV